MKLAIALILLPSLFLTADQQGQRHMNRGAFEEAAAVFEDPMRQGVAWYRAGEFKMAEQAFRQVATPEGDYNRGNCLVFMGQYDGAIKSYDRALEQRPDWGAALTNRAIARIRAAAVKREGGDMGDQKIGADEIKFDATPKKGGEDTTSEEPKPLSAEATQALWLRRVQTDPADFLESKFSYQQAMRENE